MFFFSLHTPHSSFFWLQTPPKTHSAVLEVIVSSWSYAVWRAVVLWSWFATRRCSASMVTHRRLCNWPVPRWSRRMVETRGDVWELVLGDSDCSPKQVSYFFSCICWCFFFSRNSLIPIPAARRQQKDNQAWQTLIDISLQRSKNTCNIM